MSGFTPGPWRVGADLTGICVDRRDEHGNSTPEAYSRNGWAKTVAKVTHGSWAPINEHVANARLISAAPELLEALRTVWDAYGFDPSIDSSIWQTVLAALAKATGQSVVQSDNGGGDHG